MNTFIQSTIFIQSVFTFIGFSIFFYLLYIILKKIYVKKNQSVDKFDELYKKINEDIKYAISPKFIDLSLKSNDLVELAVEVWRMDQRIMKSASTLPENYKKGIDSSIQKLQRYLKKYDIEIVDYNNIKYNEGLNLDVLSIEKDSTLSESIVKETIEPTIIYKGQVVRKAKIILLINH